MENVYPEYVTKRAIEGLVRKVKLPAPDEFSQDWEYEVSDSSRISEFLHAYENIELNIDEKFALMIIIISSFNDAIVERKAEESLASLIRNHLLQDINIHKNTISYWSMLDEEDLENCHAVTSFMRGIAYVAKLNGQD
ncbi:hypothetical protein J31TS6_00900 [Brevibacillus reuszeri]|uniref:hypothetical protein n=1 Tax=Brevibacillus reuszeri TaxID=54915 RepID=UPI001B2A09C9|nr:hypothetical protein [Brevibacillus reuszeri]GIO04062.1 hypothetical protein J31TS6_00900 [Brevibacillus reuszeri]